MWLQNWRSVPLGMMCRHTSGEVLVDHFEFFYSSVAFEVDLGMDKEGIFLKGINSSEKKEVSFPELSLRWQKWHICESS